MCPAKLNVRYICSSYYHPKRWATTQQILSQTSSTKKRITGLSSRRLFVQFNWSYIWNTETFITEVTKLFKLFFFFTIIVSRSYGHLSLFLSSFTNNTTKTANETFQPLRGIFSIQRTHELIGCRLQSLWCVQVQLSDWEAGDWRGHISCPLSLLVEVDVEHLSPNMQV